jgi:hypothetical protein
MIILLSFFFKIQLTHNIDKSSNYNPIILLCGGIQVNFEFFLKKF